MRGDGPRGPGDGAVFVCRRDRPGARHRDDPGRLTILAAELRREQEHDPERSDQQAADRGHRLGRPFRNGLESRHRLCE